MRKMIAIKNMEMPKRCIDCKLADSFCLVTRMTFQKNPNTQIQDDCPLVEVESKTDEE